MANTPIKTGDKKTDKILSSITRQMGGLQKEVRMTKGSLKDTDVTEGEFVFSTVQKDSQAPGTPTIDEGRLYFKVGGILYQLTGTKVGG